MAIKKENTTKKTTRRCKGEGSLYFNEKAQKWEGLVSYTKQDGTTDRKKFTSNDVKKGKSIVKKKMEEFEKEISETNKVFLATDKQTFGDWLDEWLNIHMKNTLKETTKSTYSGHIRLHIKPKLENYLLTVLNDTIIQDFINKLYEDGARKDGKAGGLSEETVFDIFKIINSSLNDAVEKRRLKINPAKTVTLKSIKDKEIIVLDRNEITALMKAAKTSRYYIALLLAYSTGMRRGGNFRA